MYLSASPERCLVILLMCFVNVSHTLDDTSSDSPSKSSCSGSKNCDGGLNNKIRFGEGNPPSIHVPIVDDLKTMSPKEFFSSHVKNQEAVLFKRAILKSPAYLLWNDEYFKNLDNIPVGHEVLIESRKKENRTSPPVQMNFKEWVQIYNLTDQYMVEAVPSFLRKDFMLPHHLQCDQLMRNIIVEAFMWFSSGGTSSVVHTDSVENMNCLVSGKKKFVFVPPKYADLVLFDHPEGAYSGIDVDDVNYTKYPGLAKIKFMHAEMEAGDCLYIPFKWIHQVRSYDRNIAVNVWWDTFRSTELNLDKCDSEFDPSWALDKVQFMGFAALEESPAVIRDHITGIVKKGPADYDKFQDELSFPMMKDPEFQGSEDQLTIVAVLREVFGLMDADRNGLLDDKDLDSLSHDNWEAITHKFKEITRLFSDAESEEDEQPARDEL